MPFFFPLRHTFTQYIHSSHKILFIHSLCHPFSHFAKILSFHTPKIYTLYTRFHSKNSQHSATAYTHSIHNKNFSLSHTENTHPVHTFSFKNFQHSATAYTHFILHTLYIHTLFHPKILQHTHCTILFPFTLSDTHAHTTHRSKIPYIHSLCYSLTHLALNTFFTLTFSGTHALLNFFSFSKHTTHTQHRNSLHSRFHPHTLHAHTIHKNSIFIHSIFFIIHSH